MTLMKKFKKLLPFEDQVLTTPYLNQFNINQNMI